MGAFEERTLSPGGRDLPVRQVPCYGMIKDGPPSTIPETYAYRLRNLIAHGKYRKARPGSKSYIDISFYDDDANVNAVCQHEKQAKVIFLLDTTLYSSTLAMDTVTELVNISPDNAIADQESQIIPDGDDAILINGSSIFRVVLSATVQHYYKVNHSTSLAESYRITDDSQGYRYGYGYARLSGTLAGNRLTSGVSILWETPPIFPGTDGRDYGERSGTGDVGPMTLPSALRMQATHYVVWRSKLTTDVGNDPEAWAWVDDIPIVSVFEATFTNYIGATFTHTGDSLRIPSAAGYVYSKYFNATTMTLGALNADGACYTQGYSAGYVFENNAVWGYDTWGMNVDHTDDSLNRAPGILMPEACRGWQIKLTLDAGAAFPPELNASTIYYVVPVSDTKIKLATSLANAMAGTAIAISTNGTGTFSITFLGCKSPFAIGAKYPCYASKTGTTGTILDGQTAPTANQPFFWEDGTVSWVEEQLTASTFRTHDSGAKTAQAAAWGIVARNIRDLIPDDGAATNVTGIEQRIAAEKDFYIPNRFMVAHPGGDCGAISNGLFMAADRDDIDVYYSQVAAKPQLLGYYRPDHQVIRCQVPIRHMRVYMGVCYIIHTKSTKGVNLTVVRDVGNADRGESIVKLGEPYDVDSDVGVARHETICDIPLGVCIAVTSEPEVRILRANGWEGNYGTTPEGLPAVIEYLKTVNAASIVKAAYDATAGYILWAMAAGPTLTLSLRLAVLRSQGYGWAEYYGASWLLPKGIFRLTDSSNKTRLLIWDDDREIYEHATTENYLDREDACAGEAEIATQEWQRTLTRDPQRHDHLKHIATHAYVEPRVATNRDAAGHDSDGFRDGNEWSLSVYEDGEETTADAEIADAPRHGDLIFVGSQRKAREMMFVFASTMAEYNFLGLNHDIEAIPGASTRAERTMTDSTRQLTLETSKELHVSRHKTLLFERVAGAALSGTATGITGPDGRTKSALRIAASLSLGNAAITGAYTFVGWYKVGQTVTGLGGALVALGAAVSGWQMVYYSGTNLAGAITLGAGDWFDIRLYGATVGTTELTYLRSDTVNNEGRATLPVF